MGLTFQEASVASWKVVAHPHILDEFLIDLWCGKITPHQVPIYQRTLTLLNPLQVVGVGPIFGCRDPSVLHGVEVDVGAKGDKVGVGGDDHDFVGTLEQGAAAVVGAVDGLAVAAKDAGGNSADWGVAVLARQPVVVVGQHGAGDDGDLALAGGLFQEAQKIVVVAGLEKDGVTVGAAVVDVVKTALDVGWTLWQGGWSFLCLGFLEGGPPDS